MYPSIAGFFFCRVISSDTITSHTNDGICVGTLSLTAPTSFDGSVGAVRKLNDRWQVGFYWFTQYYDLKYDFVPSDVSGSATGGIEGFSSHIQIRLGYEFLSGFFVLPAGGAWAWRRRKKRCNAKNLTWV